MLDHENDIPRMLGSRYSAGYVSIACYCFLSPGHHDSAIMFLPWNLANNISDGPARLHIVQLIAKEIHILFHTRDKGIVDVDLSCQNQHITPI